MASAIFLAFYIKALAWSFPPMELPDYRFIVPPAYSAPAQQGSA